MQSSNTKPEGSNHEFDVLIIGGGLSGINAAYRIQEGLPDLSYAILESKDVIGGTWSLFKYPGFRSDSDLYQFGFPFEPWQEENIIADGSSICRYLNNVATKYGIDKHTKMRHRVSGLDWRSDEYRWKVDVVVNEAEDKVFHARFVILCTGYYDYKEGRQVDIAGIKDFSGTVVHPQFWPADLDYEDKKVVIIGSGATAATILPAIANDAKEVVLLQRSPGYYIKVPRKDSPPPFSQYFPKRWTYMFQRMKAELLGFLFYHLCYYFPTAGRQVLLGGVRQQLPPHVPMSHFEPTYAPFSQRLLFDPDGDFFAALRSKKASIVTGRITGMQDRTINLVPVKDDQKQQDAISPIEDVDIIVTATGLKVSFLTGMNLSVSSSSSSASSSPSTSIHIPSKFIWRGACLQDIPNFGFTFGYVNNVWTLGCDASCQLLVRLIRKTLSIDPDRSSFTPEVPSGTTLTEVPMFDATSGYLVEAVKRGVLPKAASTQPWRPRWHYFSDLMFAKYGGVGGLVFRGGAGDVSDGEASKKMQ